LVPSALTPDSLLAEFRKVDDPARAKELGFSESFFDVEHDFVLASKKM
jgi:catechol 1,2-dioxygenase